MTKATFPTTGTEKGMKISFKNTEFTEFSILADIDMRQGAPVGETGWLDGNSGGDYPGSLTGFLASNSDGNAVGSLRQVTIQFNVETALEEVFVITEGCSKILAITGSTMPAADKTLSLSFTNTGKDADPPTKDNGALPAVVVHAEAATDACTVTLLLLN